MLAYETAATKMITIWVLDMLRILLDHDDFHVCFSRSPDHVSRTSSSWKCDDKGWSTFIDHSLIPYQFSPSTETMPIGHISFHFNSIVSRPPSG
jgi:hypothetical protein